MTPLIPSLLSVGLAVAQVADMPGWISNLGLGGILIWIIITRLERLDHTIKGLSMALWMDLASRPHTEDYIRNEAKKMLAKIEANKK